jgi:hypothetical protein
VWLVWIVLGGLRPKCTVIKPRQSSPINSALGVGKSSLCARLPTCHTSYFVTRLPPHAFTLLALPLAFPPLFYMYMRHSLDMHSILHRHH